ncbi:MAG TPA: hypothetical protein VF744_17695 [Beijerinckiaceae bacterium]|jgi:hypothetical protein
MKKVLLLAASVLMLTAFLPEEADAQGRGVRGARGVRGGVVVGPRGGVAVRRGYGYRPGYAYRRGYGWGPAAAVGVLGAAALGAAVAAPAYGYDPCLRQQQVIDPYTGYATWQYVRVC